MLVLAIFHFLYTLYCGFQILIHYCKTKEYHLPELIDLFCDICRSILLLLVGLASEKIIHYNWFLFCIPLVLDIAGRILIRQMAAKKTKKPTQ